MMKRKMITAAFLAGAVLYAGITPATAYAGVPAQEMKQAYDGERLVQPRYSYTEDVVVGLYFDGNVAECEAMVIGKDVATKITGTLKLEKKNSNGAYSSVKSWSVSEPSGEVIVSKSCTVSSKGEYRLRFNGKVYAGSAYETISNSVRSIYE